MPKCGLFMGGPLICSKFATVVGDPWFAAAAVASAVAMGSGSVFYSSSVVFIGGEQPFSRVLIGRLLLLVLLLRPFTAGLLLLENTHLGFVVSTLNQTKHNKVKTGSLCCVAARPQESPTSNDGWSTAAQEPHWRSNEGFSPVLSSSWLENKSQPEDLATTSDASQFRQRSLSSSSRGSRSGSRLGSARLIGHFRRHSESFFSLGDSPFDSFRTNVCNPLALSSDHISDIVPAPTVPTSSPTIILSSSKQTSSEAVSLPYQERLRWTNASSPSDFGWGSTYEGVDKATGLLSVERIRARNTQSASASSHSETCGVCNRLLSQQPPWSSHRMVGITDCTVVGVLVCGHVYHAECLEQASPDSLRQDPTCPQCGIAEKAATKVKVLEPVASRGVGVRGTGALAPTSSRNKLSRIGVATDDITGPEVASRGAQVSSVHKETLNAGGKPRSPYDLFQTEHLFRSRSLSRKQFPVKHRLTRGSSSDIGWRWPTASPAFVSPDDWGVGGLNPPSKNWRSKSFSLLRMS
ncbi:hypothetical protein BDL97_02G027800 [Sphagnum fallax]|nr:hypothetical protein BDL97_02G027800 [Sphagnum fallax]